MGEIEMYKDEVATTQGVVSKLKYENITSGYQTALQVVDDIVLKNYIGNLSSMPVIPLTDDVLKKNIRDNVRLFKITEMVYEQEEFATYKFASVFNSLATTESAVFVIIDSDGTKTDFYMGIRSIDPDRTASSLKDTIENAMKGQFPGLKIKDDYTVENVQEMLSKIKYNSVSAVSCVANSRANNIDKNQNFVQGLEKLVLSMQGEKYTGIIIANGTTSAQLKELRRGYENVYTQMSTFANTQVNYTSNKSINFSLAEIQSINKSVNKTTTTTKTKGRTTTSSSSYAKSISRESVAGKTIKGIASAATILGAALTPVTGGIGLVVGGIVSGATGMIGSAVSKNVSDSGTAGKSVSKNITEAIGRSKGFTQGESYGNTRTEGYSNGMTEGITLTLHDKTVEGILQRIDKQLKRIDEFESLGMYECAAYFLSEDQYAAEVAASTYKALMRGENSGVEIAAINSWGNSEKKTIELISQYIINFMHPVFKYEGFTENIEVTPCSLVSGSELAIHMGLPRRSVCGLPVIEHADFGKEVVTYDSENKGASIRLGKVFNMGSECANDVRLNIRSLSMHTFITGSTGSGKSNTVYELIRQLDNAGVNYMVIEPAKGEYKNIFGLSSGVNVYGTNPAHTELLRINPFKFPDGVHVLEHADRIVEIFNVCWPMYAAMPAVLKDAVLQAYKKSGWDLAESTNKYSEVLFPTFQDLLDDLVDVINKSAYSEEVKSNYTGSLVTRVKSLTNGLNGLIFSAHEIGDEILFNRKVIIDLSRIGSLETKSLIMGILIMRLSEYRMTSCAEMNAPLKHITVLEEAHNILKRTSTEQNLEESNVAGKSVEMISNAIAEMRTYGEGFIIADQSPSAVDISAIRNTNTKIIMRLPDEQDRRLVGKAAGLKDKQLDEIAKLPKGVAVVYQNDWIEAVLCKVKKFEGEARRYVKIDLKKTFPERKQKQILVKNLLNKCSGEKLDVNVQELTEILTKLDIPTKTKIKILKVFHKNGSCPMEMIGSIFYDLVSSPELERELENAESIEEWKNSFIYMDDEIFADLDNNDQNTIIECILKNQIEHHNESNEYLEIWKRFVDGEVM